MSQVKCPECQSVLRLPTDPPWGSRVRCPSCRSAFRLSKPEPPEEVIEIFEETEEDPQPITPETPPPAAPAAETQPTSGPRLRTAPVVTGFEAARRARKNKAKRLLSKGALLGFGGVAFGVVSVVAAVIYVAGSGGDEAPSEPGPNSVAETSSPPRSSNPDHNSPKPHLENHPKERAPAHNGPVDRFGEARPVVEYHFRKGDTHSYRIRVSADTNEGRRLHTGTCTFTVQGDGAAVAPDAAELKGSGTGFMVTSNGYLITCAHVVEDVTDIIATVNGERYPARVVAVNGKQDVALLKIKAEGLPVLPLARADLKLAQPVRVVGFPLSTVLGRDVKITSGTVSGFVNSDPERPRVQLDAAINPGNSGGPVVNDRGEVVAVASAKLGGEMVTAVGFAVPIRQAAALLKRKGIQSGATGADQLTGPQLAERVRPAVVFLEVTADPMAHESYRLSFSGTLSQVTRSNDPRVLMRSGFTTPAFDRGSVVVNKYGEVGDFKGKEHLPFVLGPLGLFPFEPIDHHGEKSWTNTQRIELNQIQKGRNLFPGLGPRFGRRPGFGRFPGIPDPFEREQPRTVRTLQAIETVTYQVRDSDEKRVVLAKNYSLRTTDNPQRPFLNISGQGTIIFDRELGVPERLTYKSTLQQRTDEGRARLPIEFSYVRQTDEEIAEEKQRIAEMRAKREKDRAAKKAAEDAIPADQRVAAILDSLNKTANRSPHWTIDKLARMEVVESKQKEVNKVLLHFAQTGQHFPQKSALNALRTWGTEAEVPVVAKLLLQKKIAGGSFARREGIAFLAGFPGRIAAEAIAAQFVHSSTRSAAAAALTKMGAVAEKPTAALLENLDAWVRRSAIKILGEIGTSESLAPLEALQKKETDHWNKRELTTAIAKIKLRAK